MNKTIPKLPFLYDIETKAVLKQALKAHKAIAELKGATGIIPNQSILIDTLALQEAKDSSAIENIVTTHDELFQGDVVAKKFISHAAKEVHNYVEALRLGFDNVKKTGLLTNNCIIEMQSILVENNAGFRKLPGTELKNDQTGETVYTPPQDARQIVGYMNNLEKFINDPDFNSLDPLISMAIIHHQFESIHPFYDGNGRTGRIINILYLVKNGLLDSPILYLSRYINQTKGEYYRLLQSVRSNHNWEEWVIYMLNGVEKTSKQTLKLIYAIKDLMATFKIKMRDETKFYSHDLLNNLFRHPYTKVDFVTRELQIHRNTALKYLDELVAIGLLKKHKIKKENYYLNTGLFDLLSNVDSLLDN